MPRTFVIACPLDRLVVGEEFERAAWPLHVTVLSNFDWDRALPELVDSVTQALEGCPSIGLVVGDEAMFGPDATVRVNLIHPSLELVALHEALVGDGMRFHEPSFLRDGFRPHVTHFPGRRLFSGDRVRLQHAALVELAESSATVRAIWSLGQA